MPSAVGYQPTLATEMGELQERIASTKNGSVTSVQAVYVPADDLTEDVYKRQIFIKPLSLCMRLFGNVLGSFVIMELLKMVVPAIVPAVFSCYFDIFDGLIQAYVFVFLTGLFIKEATE